MLDALRIANIVLWLLVAGYCLPSATNAAFGKVVRRGDPMRLAVFVTALIMAGFCVRWFIAPNDLTLWVALYVLCAADAVWIAALARSYGRGGSVERE